MALSNRKNKNRNKNGRVDRVGVKGTIQDGRGSNVDRVRKEDLQEDVSTIVKVWNQIAIIIFSLLFQFFQLVLVTFFKPRTPTTRSQPTQPYGRIAVIGAGLTGVSTAAHCIAHNFDVVIYEKGDDVGGIWSRVNESSGLQINSIMYRFHPAVIFKEGFPMRNEILNEIYRISREYNLDSRTRLNTEVKKVTRANDPLDGVPSKWIINDGEDGEFDAVICAVGTCGEPIRVDFEGSDAFVKAGGRIVHSSETDRLLEGLLGGDTSGAPGPAPSEIEEQDQPPPVPPKAGEPGDGKYSVEGKSVVVVGSGASGVEAAEWAIEKSASRVVLLARKDKWIIPRNVVIDMLLGMQPFGRQMPLSFIPESLIKRYHYGDMAYLAPTDEGLFEGTPIVNDTFLPLVQTSQIEYIQCETTRYTERGVVVKPRQGLTWDQTRTGPPMRTIEGDDGVVPVGEDEVEVEADLVVLATGFKRPEVGFLPGELFPQDYERPNLYLQIFSTEDWSVALPNAAFEDAIGTVGNLHIGTYTRILLTFLMDPSTRPKPGNMKLWVDAVRFIKGGATEGRGALGFFTYMELMTWLVGFHAFRMGRLKWMPFILSGWGVPIVQ